MINHTPNEKASTTAEVAPNESTRRSRFQALTINGLRICSRTLEAMELITHAAGKLASISSDRFFIGDIEVREDIVGLSARADALLQDTALTLGRLEGLASQQDAKAPAGSVQTGPNSFQEWIEAVGWSISPRWQLRCTKKTTGETWFTPAGYSAEEAERERAAAAAQWPEVTFTVERPNDSQ